MEVYRLSVCLFVFSFFKSRQNNLFIQHIEEQIGSLPYSLLTSSRPLILSVCLSRRDMYNHDTYYMIQFLAVPKATDDRDEVQTCFDKTKKGKERRKKKKKPECKNGGEQAHFRWTPSFSKRRQTVVVEC